MCTAEVRREWTRSLTRSVPCTVRHSTANSAGAPGLFPVDANSSPFGSEDATPGFSACARVPGYFGRVGRAGLPGVFWCASPFLLAVLSFVFARPAPGPGSPCFLFPLFCLLSFLIFFRCWRPHCLRFFVLSGPACPWSWRCVFFLPASRPCPPGVPSRAPVFCFGLELPCFCFFVCGPVFFFLVFWCVVFSRPPPPFFFPSPFILFCCPGALNFCFCFPVCLSPCSVFLPLLPPPLPALFFCFYFFFSVRPFSFALCFLFGGGLLPRARPSCGVARRAVAFGGVSLLVVVRLLMLVCAPSLAALVVCGAARFVLLFCVLLSAVVLFALWCVCGRDVPCWRACVVLFGAVVCCVVLLLAVLCCCLLRIFCLGRGVLCCLVRCSASLLPVVCGTVLCWAVLACRCPAPCWAASCRVLALSCVVARCCAFCGIPRCCAVPVGVALGCSVLLCAFLCCVVWFILLRCFFWSLPCHLSWCGVLGCGTVVASGAACGVLCSSPLCCVWWRVSCSAVVCCAGVSGSRRPVLCSAVVWSLVGAWSRCLFFFGGVRWWAWLPDVVFWWWFWGLMSLSGCLALRPVACRLSVVPCGVLLPCVASCGAVPPCRAVLWCPAVFFCLAGGAGFLSPVVALAGAVCCCLLLLGVRCWVWLFPVVSWWILVACFLAAVPVSPRGSLPCDLLWCV